MVSVSLVAWGGTPVSAADDEVAPEQQVVQEGPREGVEPPVTTPVAPREAAEVSVVADDLAAGEEVVAERTASSKTFATDEGGVFETRLFGAPVHFQDRGEWVEIDTDLVPAAGGRLESEANAFGLSVADEAGDPELVRVELGEGASVAWGIDGVEEASPGSGGRGSAGGPGARSVDGAVAEFEEVLPGVDLVVESTPSGVKEDLVLADASAPTVFEFPLSLEGVQAVAAGGGVEFRDAEGVVVGTVPAGFMVDAADALSEDVTMTLVGDEDDPVLRVEIDADWLADPDRVFPVRVDPTVRLDTGVDDTHVRSSLQDTDFSGHPWLVSGRTSDGVLNRSLMQFDTAGLDGKTVNWATLNLYNNYSRICTPSTVTVKEVTQEWTGSSVHWPGPATGAVVGSTTAAKGGPDCAPGWLSIRVSQVVREWASGAKTDNGFAVVADESTADGYKRYASAEDGDGVGPYLLVNWRESLLGNLGYYTMNTAPLTDRLQMHANPANGNLLLEAADLRLPGVAGTDLTVGRYYNSREDVEREGMTGTGWALGVGQDVRLSVNGTDRAGFFEGPSGYRISFPYNSATGTWDKPAGLNATMTQNGTGFDYTVEFHGTGLSYRFVGGPALDAIEDKNGNTITFNYTGSRVSSVTDTLGGVTDLAYNSQGLLSSITDPDGRVVSYGYDGTDLVSSTDATGAVTTYAYDGQHNLVSVTDPEGGVTGYTYDGQDRLVDIEWADSTTADPAVTTYEYLSGNRTELTDPNGNNEWLYVFDDMGRIEKFYSPRSGVGQTYAYDVFNSVTDYTNSNGGIGTLSYDGYNVMSVQSDNGAMSTFEYQDPDSENRPSKLTDPRGVVLGYDWDDKEQLTSVTADNDGTTTQSTMTYRSESQSCAGSIATAKDGRGTTTSYSYDSRCRLIEVDRPAPAGDTTMTYDAFDRVRTVTDGNGVVQTISYDANDRVTKISWPSSQTSDPKDPIDPDPPDPTGVGTSSILLNEIAYAYDGNGNRTERVDIQDGSTKSTNWALDARNRVVVEELPNVTNSYSYDPAGNMASHTGPGGTTTYTYDKENDVKTLTPPVGGPITFDYYEHTFAAVDFPNGTTDAQHYDTDGRIQRIDQYFYDRDASVYRQLADYRYDYTNPATGADTNSVYQIDDPDYDWNLTYEYDSQGRIASSYGESLGDIFEETSYSYDANSNRTAWEKGSRGIVNQYTADYNAANQMTSTTGPNGTTTFTYDGVGNLTGDSAGTDISYDDRNRATSIEHRYGNAGPQGAEYDGTSQFERTGYGETTFTNSLLGVTSSADATGTTYYLRAPDGRVLGERRPDGETLYYLSDRLGSIVGATDTDGHRAADYGYDPYGEYTYGSGGGENLIHWRYTGAWLDGDSVTGNGFYKIGLRYYDNQHGRWTQTDPLERVINPTQPAEAQPYNYAGCNPTNQTDPTGAFSWGCLGTSVGVGAAGGAATGFATGWWMAIFGPPGMGGWLIWTTSGAVGGAAGGGVVGLLTCW